MKVQHRLHYLSTIQATLSNQCHPINVVFQLSFLLRNTTFRLVILPLVMKLKYAHKQFLEIDFVDHYNNQFQNNDGTISLFVMCLFHAFK